MAWEFWEAEVMMGERDVVEGRVGSVQNAAHQQLNGCDEGESFGVDEQRTRDGMS
ncbi:MAG: hypothetical protein KC643_23455 [Nitrospira sp.]|nr:hypothetical protein [Nitrospira sp.]